MPADDIRGALRGSYDEIADEYAARLGDELDYKPLDRALLAMLVEESGHGAPCADLGCGPGHVTAWLARAGARPVGIDLSPGMLEVARRDRRDLEYRQGDLVDLPALDGEFAFAVALYSIIHLSSDDRRSAFFEMRRVLRPGAAVLVAFHVGADERHHVAEWWGHAVDMEGWYLSTGRVSAELEDAGLVVEARVERANYPREAATDRAYLLARRPV